MKQCVHCEQTKPKSEFWRYYRTSDGLQSWCKDCSYARVQEYWAAYPDKKRQTDTRARKIYRARIKRERMAS